MDKFITDMIGEILDFRIKHEYLFRKLYGFTFVFRRDIILFNDQLSSAEIKPIGIIYEEKGEFYYAPLHAGDEIDEIVREFVKKEGEYLRF